MAIKVSFVDETKSGYRIKPNQTFESDDVANAFAFVGAMLTRPRFKGEKWVCSVDADDNDNVIIDIDSVKSRDI